MRLIILFLLIICGLGSLKAQTSNALKRDTLSIKEDSIKKKKNILLKSAIGAGYAGTGIFCYKFIDTREQIASQKNQTPLKNEVAKLLTPLGSGKVNWIACGSTAGFAYLTKNIKLQKASFIWAGSLLINESLTCGLKSTFQRHRPNTGDPFNTFDWSDGTENNRSFPSAHTSYSFTTAAVFATLYKDKKWVPPLTYGLATLIGFSRVYHNAHWASDIMAGAAIGFVSAKAMVGLYRFFDKRFIVVIPQIGQKFSSLKIIYKL